MMKENLETTSNYFQKVGNGEKTIVFLHYFGGAASSWQWLVAILSKDYVCITINLPGFGGTAIHQKPSVVFYANFVEKILAENNIETYILVGHSMSGKIALQIALQNQTKAIQKLILLAPSPPTVERMPNAEKERMLNHPNLKVAEETVHKITIKPLSEFQFKTAVDTQLQIVEAVWQWWIKEGMKTPLATNPKYLQNLPITVITSTDDPCITITMIDEEVMPNLPPQSKLITCSGVGHLYPMEDPEWLTEAIKKCVNL